MQVEPPAQKFEILNTFPEHAAKVHEAVFCNALFVFVTENGAHWIYLNVGPTVGDLVAEGTTDGALEGVIVGKLHTAVVMVIE